MTWSRIERLITKPSVATFLIVGFSLMLALSQGGRVGAIGTVAPDPGDYISAPTGGVYLEVSSQDASNALDAVTSSVTIYSTDSTPTISIYHPNHCSGANIDSANPGSVPGNWDTTFTFGGANQVYPAGSLAGRNTISTGTSCENTVWNTTLTGLSKSTAPGLTGYYKATLTATIRTDSTGLVNAFKVRTSSGYVSFFTSNKKFAIGNRDTDRNSPVYDRFDLKFAASCDVTVSKNVNLISYDDDQGEGNQLRTLSYDLIRTKKDGSGAVTVLSYTPGPGGQDRTISKGVTILQGYNYIWRWYNVSSANGIQFQLPFDSIYSKVTCAQPNSAPTGSVVADCNADGTGKATGTFTDDDGNTNGHIIVGTYQSPDNGSPHSWSPIPADQVDSNWTVTLYVQDVGSGGDQAYHVVGTDTHTKCEPPNQPPRSDSRGSTCAGGITGYAYDPDNSAKVSIYVYVNPSPDPPPSSFPSTAAPTPQGADGFHGPNVANLANPSWTPASIPEGHGFSISTPIKPQNYNGDYNSNTYWIYLKDTVSGELFRSKKLVQPACASVSCTDGSATIPATITTNSSNSFTVGGTVTGSTAPPPGTQFVIIISNDATGVRATLGGANGHDYGYTGTTTLTSSPSAVFTPTTSGNYTLHWAINGQDGDCIQNLKVGYAPYFRVENGNASAGAGFTNASNSCSQSAATISGSGSGSPGFFGAGTQLAAFVMGSLTDFNTSTNDITGGSSGVAGLTASLQNGLAFGNTGTSPGMLASLACVEDYVKTATNGVTTQPLPIIPILNTVDISTLASGTYVAAVGSTVITFTQSSAMPANRHVTVVITSGSAFIASNIMYATSGPNAYTSLDQAPQFRLLVGTGGRIGIRSSVNELHGAYVAQPTSTSAGGIISTCSYVLLGALYDLATKAGCDQPLTFYGSVAANQLLLERTYGSYIASPSDGALQKPAEVFNYSPELWAAQNPTITTGAPKYDAITSLPPTL